MAQQMAKVAFDNSLDKTRITPYSRAATEAFDMVRDSSSGIAALQKQQPGQWASGGLNAVYARQLDVDRQQHNITR
jgi:hypothetical protein